MRIDAKTVRHLTEPVRDCLLGWLKDNGLPDAANILEIDVGDTETTVTLVLREPNGDFAMETDDKGRTVRLRTKAFTYQTSTLPGRLRRALA